MTTIVGMLIGAACGVYGAMQGWPILRSLGLTIIIVSMYAVLIVAYKG